MDYFVEIESQTSNVNTRKCAENHDKIDKKENNKMITKEEDDYDTFICGAIKQTT